MTIANLQIHLVKKDSVTKLDKKQTKNEMCIFNKQN